MLLFNRDFAGRGGAERLRERKALLGVAALRSEADGLYSPGLWVMTSPASRADGVDILVHHMSGRVAFGGAAHIAGDRARFRIRAVAHPGALLVEIEGVFGNGQVEIVKALSGVLVQKGREPLRG